MTDQTTTIPRGWKMTILEEVLERITKGTTPKDFSLNKNDINYIKSESLSYEGVIDELKFVKITNETNDELQRSKLKENDILLSMAGIYLGKTGLVKKEMLPANTNQAVAILTVNSQVDFKFLLFKLRSKDSVNYFNSTPSQSAQPNINFEEIKSLPIFLPPLPEQRAIAAVLSSLDDKIELLREQNKTLEAAAQAIFKEWFVNFNFPGATGEITDSVLGEIPEGWRAGKYSDLADVVTGKGIKKEDLRNDGIYQVLGANGEIGKTNEYLFDEDLILTGRVGTLGTIFFSKGRVWISDNVLISKPLTEENYYFAYFQLKQLNFGSMNRGSTQPLITQTDLKNVEIIIPDNKLLKEWHILASSIFNKSFNNNSQIQTLSALRDTLLPKLMKGEVRVKVRAIHELPLQSMHHESHHELPLQFIRRI